MISLIIPLFQWSLDYYFLLTVVGTMFRAVLKLHVPFQLGLTRMNIIPAISTRAISSFVSTIPEGAAENSQAKEWLVIIPDRKGVVRSTKTAS